VLQCVAVCCSVLQCVAVCGMFTRQIGDEGLVKDGAAKFDVCYLLTSLYDLFLFDIIIIIFCNQYHCVTFLMEPPNSMFDTS